METEGAAVGLPEREGVSSWVWWGSVWVRVEGEVREGEGGWWWAV